MSYNTVIFDLDGTILNTLDDLAAAVNHALVSCGYPTHGTDKIRSFIGNGIDILIRRAIPNECTDEEWQRARDIFKAYYTKHMTDNTAPYNGIKELLERLRADGIKTAVVTNKNHDMANELIPSFYNGLFDIIIGTDLAKRERKPAPDGIYAVLDVLGTDKKDAVYIGDTEVDVQTAHNAGLKCIGVMWGFRQGGKIEGADFVVNTPEEILEIVR